MFEDRKSGDIGNTVRLQRYVITTKAVLERGADIVKVETVVTAEHDAEDACIRYKEEV